MPVIDMDEMINYIIEHSEIEQGELTPEQVEQVLDLEVEYLESIGLAESIEDDETII